jgi:hypothetical protein
MKNNYLWKLSRILPLIGMSRPYSTPSMSELMKGYHLHRRRGVNRSYLKLLVGMKGFQRPTSLHIKLRGLMAPASQQQRRLFRQMITPLKMNMRMTTLREWCVPFPSWIPYTMLIGSCKRKWRGRTNDAHELVSTACLV